MIAAGDKACNPIRSLNQIRMQLISPAEMIGLLQGIKPAEPAGDFVFKTQRGHNQGAGQVATRPQKSRRRQTSSFKPFQLSTDVSDAGRPGYSYPKLPTAMRLL